MKFWKGNVGTPKEGQYGTSDDSGFVPDSVECSQEKYQVYVDSIPAHKEVKRFITLEDANKNIVKYEVVLEEFVDVETIKP